MTAPTSAEALRLAREALEDDRKATPGPWVIEWTDDGRVSDISADGRDGIVQADCGVYPPKPDDGRFIAAARTREPALAAWVASVLGNNRLRSAYRVNVHDDGGIYVSDHAPKMDGSHVRLRLSPTHARALVAELLRAIDRAERANPTNLYIPEGAE